MIFRKYFLSALSCTLILPQTAFADIEKGFYYSKPSQKTEQKQEEPALQNPADIEPQSGAPAEHVRPQAVQDMPSEEILSPQNLIAAGQKISITVKDEAELTNIYPVTSDGSVAFPLLGKISVAGLSPQTAQEKISMLLANGFLVNPQVSLGIVQNDPIFVVGLVNSPGSTIYQTGITVEEALKQAGGLTASADPSSFEVLRTEAGKNQGMRKVGTDEILAAGDILMVKSAPKN